MITELEETLYEQVSESLKDVIDPDVGVNVVDLGLIYGLAWDDAADALVINMTLTTAECPLQEMLADQTADALDGIVGSFSINWVWSPPWNMQRVTADGREMMRAIGFNI